MKSYAVKSCMRLDQGREKDERQEGNKIIGMAFQLVVVIL